MVNEGGHGFYRVRYDADLLRARCCRRLPRLAAIERFNLVNDAWAVTLAGLMPLTDYLDLTARFRDERDKNVWSILIGSLAMLNRLATPDDRPGLEALVRDRVTPALAALGWDSRTGRGRADPSAARRSHPRARHARQRSLRAGAGGGALRRARPRHDRRSTPTCCRRSSPCWRVSGDAERYDEFVERFRAATTPQEEQRYLYALTAFPQPELVAQTLARDDQRGDPHAGRAVRGPLAC